MSGVGVTHQIFSIFHRNSEPFSFLELMKSRRPSIVLSKVGYEYLIASTSTSSRGNLMASTSTSTSIVEILMASTSTSIMKILMASTSTSTSTANNLMASTSTVIDGEYEYCTFSNIFE